MCSLSDGSMSQKPKSQLEAVPWPNLGQFECQTIKYSSEL